MLRRFLRLIRTESGGAVVLLLAAVVALAWANSPWGHAYERIRETPFVFGTIEAWVDDGLMTIFFLAVGLEIRHEAHDGDLSTLRRAALPVAAAFGGMVAPALIYLLVNRGSPFLHGWGVPVATDIAFSVGVLALLGKRIPSSARVLLLALAVVDDIGAVVVIGVAYARDISLPWLLVASAGTLALSALRATDRRGVTAYAIAGAIVWLGLSRGGIHPALAGVVVGLAVPVSGLEKRLQPWVTLLVMPPFAFANAGVRLGSIDLGGGRLALILGVGLGLVVGKPLGVLTASALAVRLRLASLPSSLDWRSVAVVGCLAGIGFTMSIFIAALAFADESTLGVAKLSVLIATVVSGALGALVSRSPSRSG
jgi:NhaA family Na+:H+ antiporter